MPGSCTISEDATKCINIYLKLIIMQFKKELFINNYIFNQIKALFLDV